MRAISKLIFLFLSVLCFSNIVEAFENCGVAVRFENFHERGPSLVRHIITNNKGVFLQVGNSWIATEGLQVLGERMIVLVNGEWITIGEALENPECARSTWPCAICGFINYEGMSACGVCGNPRPKKRD